jgi:nitric oxide reductase NorE protein
VRPGAPTRGHIPGEAGLWVFLLLDLVVFSVFFGTIVMLRADSPDAFAAGRDELHQGLALAATVLLLSGSLFVVRAVRAMRTGDGEAAARWLTGAAAAGIGFVAVKAVEYSELLGAGHGLRTDDFFLAYFAFTGVHLVHVVLGTAVLLFLRRHVATRRVEDVRHGLVEGGASYWHMVDLLWLILLPLLYLS